MHCNGSWFAYFKLFYFRKFDNLTSSLTNAELSKIERITNCKTPCNYNEYKLANNPPREFTDFGNETAFGLMAISENTEFQEEVLLYPRSKSENIHQWNQFFQDFQKCSNILWLLMLYCELIVVVQKNNSQKPGFKKMW